MSMSICDVKAAFRQVASEEFRNVPEENMVEWTFSSQFEKKMSKLIRKEKCFAWKYVNTAKKRLVVAAVIIAALCAAACGITPIRTKVVNFFRRVYETSINVTFVGDKVDSIEYKYTFSYVPEGFRKVCEYSDITRYYVEWKDNNDNRIQYTQSAISEADIYIDKENIKHHVIVINGKIINVYTSGNVTVAEWVENQYFFTILITGDCPTSVLKKIIGSLK
ncbi:MAG: DUF4367 domain-containing protein [Eubacteriales bacterium]|jgi:hypothetical protein